MLWGYDVCEVQVRCTRKTGSFKSHSKSHWPSCSLTAKRIARRRVFIVRGKPLASSDVAEVISPTSYADSVVQMGLALRSCVLEPFHVAKTWQGRPTAPFRASVTRWIFMWGCSKRRSRLAPRMLLVKCRSAQQSALSFEALEGGFALVYWQREGSERATLNPKP